MKKLAGAILLLALVIPVNALAHHGGVSLAFGPGSPIETNSPLTLPEGGFVVSTRIEQVDWRSFDFAEPANKTEFTFMNAGLSYGFTSYLTGSLFVPYSIKREDTFGSNRGLADLRFQANLGFNHDTAGGFRLNSAEDTAVTLESVPKTYFGLSLAVTAPTGKSHEVLDGEIDRAMQPGFRSPSVSVGSSAARMMFNNAFTLVGELSYDIFTESDNFKFGNEFRTNLALVRELYGSPNAFLSKLDGILEFNLLNIGRDEEGGDGQPATGGTMLYISPGMRFTFPKLQNASLGLLVKLPVWKDLNEQSEQQGAEGLENYRFIATLSFFF